MPTFTDHMQIFGFKATKHTRLLPERGRNVFSSSSYTGTSLVREEALTASCPLSRWGRGLSGRLFIRATATELTISVQPRWTELAQLRPVHKHACTTGDEWQRRHPLLGHFTAASQGGAGTRRHLPRASQRGALWGPQERLSPRNRVL